MMVPHHEGALGMARIAQQRAERPELRQLAEDILRSQDAEINPMRQWRQEWFGSSATPAMDKMPMVPYGGDGARWRDDGYGGRRRTTARGVGSIRRRFHSCHDPAPPERNRCLAGCPERIESARNSRSCEREHRGAVAWDRTDADLASSWSQTGGAPPAKPVTETDKPSHMVPGEDMNH